MDNFKQKIVIKKFFPIASKIIIAAFLAFCILNVFCIPYYNLPIHAINTEDTADYKWEAKGFYSRGNEGFAWGVINNDGFANNFDYTPGMPLDVLVMGSSHMEAFNVAMEESTTNVLNKLLGKNAAYNIGMSAHTLLILASHLKNAVSKYKPSKFVVLETVNLTFPVSDLKETLKGSIKYNYFKIHSGIKNILQRIPYVRLLHTQMVNTFKLNNFPDNHLEKKASDESLIDALLKKIKDDAGGTKVIILFHPETKLVRRKKLKLLVTRPAIKQFKRLCKKHGIIFVDMSKEIKKLYKTNHTLAYGFPNTAISSGHINKHGHAIFAQKLYEVMQKEGA